MFISGADEFLLSTDFTSRHFLAGALLSEMRSALGEVAEVQRVAISVLRDILAKHSFDDRYLQSVSYALFLLEVIVLFFSLDMLIKLSLLALVCTQGFMVILSNADR